MRKSKRQIEILILFIFIIVRPLSGVKYFVEKYFLESSWLEDMLSQKRSDKTCTCNVA